MQSDNIELLMVVSLQYYFVVNTAFCKMLLRCTFVILTFNYSRVVTFIILFIYIGAIISLLLIIWS